jgi:hypothetical protein
VSGPDADFLCGIHVAERVHLLAVTIAFDFQPAADPTSLMRFANAANEILLGATVVAGAADLAVTGTLDLCFATERNALERMFLRCTRTARDLRPWTLRVAAGELDAETGVDGFLFGTHQTDE